MTLEILLFASYREQAGVKTLTLELPQGATVRAAASALEARYPELKLTGALAAIDETYATPDTLLADRATLAFFPPVAGGSGETDFFFVTDEALALAHYITLVSAPEFGALSTFSGTVRSPNLEKNVSYIDYQGYEAMILKEMKRAAAELRGSFELGGLVFAHRLGKLLPGDASIVIVIASKHRRDGLLATHAAIDRLKEMLPVWKLEANEDGTHWVEGTAPAETL